jgi:hypothetical protein
MVGTEGTAGVSAFVAAAITAGVLAATLSSRFGSIFGDGVWISVPPANPIITAANTVPTPAKKDVVLKAMSVSTFRSQRGRGLGVPRLLPFFPMQPHHRTEPMWLVSIVMDHIPG